MSNSAMWFVFAILVFLAIVGLRALVRSENDDGRFAGAALVVIAITAFALILSWK